MSEEEKRAWISRHLARAPERDEKWHERVNLVYLAGQDDFRETPAA